MTNQKSMRQLIALFESTAAGPTDDEKQAWYDDYIEQNADVMDSIHQGWGDAVGTFTDAFADHFLDKYPEYDVEYLQQDALSLIEF